MLDLLTLEVFNKDEWVLREYRRNGVRINLTAILLMQYTKASKVTYILLDHFVLDTQLDGMSEDMFKRERFPKIGVRINEFYTYESEIDPDRLREDRRLKINFKCLSVKLVEYARIEITIKDIES